jgi:hypothetical protein
MNNPYLLSESDNRLMIDKILHVGLESGADCQTKWTAGIVLLADVLLRQDELSQHRLLAGLPAELRAALEGIREIQRTGVSPNAPERLQ